MKLQTKLKAVHFCCIDATTNFTSFWKTGNNSSGFAQQNAKANKLPHWCKIYTAVIVHWRYISSSLLYVVGSLIHKSQNKRKTLSFQCCNKYLYPKQLVSQCYILPFSSMLDTLAISGRCMPLMSHISSILSPCCTGCEMMQMQGKPNWKRCWKCMIIYTLVSNDWVISLELIN